MKMTNFFLKQRWQGIPGLDGEATQLTSTERIIQFYEKQIVEHEEMLAHHKNRLRELQTQLKAEEMIAMRGPLCHRCERREKNCYCGSFTSFWFDNVSSSPHS